MADVAVRCVLNFSRRSYIPMHTHVIRSHASVRRRLWQLVDGIMALIRVNDITPGYAAASSAIYGKHADLACSQTFM